VRRKKSNTSSTLLGDIDPRDEDEEVNGSDADDDQVFDTASTTMPMANGETPVSNSDKLTNDQAMSTQFHSDEDDLVPKHSTPILPKKSSSDSLITIPVSATGTPNDNTIIVEKDKQRLHLNNQRFQAVSRKGDEPLDTTATINNQQLQSFQNPPLSTGQKKDFKTG